MKIESQKCLSVAETARLLGICESKVYRLVREGSLPHLRIGRRLIIPTTALQEWIGAQVRGGEQLVDIEGG